jgi:hypothetical protein
MMKGRAIHTWFNDSQMAMLQAQSLVENRSMSSIIKTAALQYVAQYKLKLASPINYVKHVPQEIKTE